MKQIGEPKRVTAANALGQDSTCIHTQFEIEESDVGTERNHYLGYGYQVRTFRRDEVGRKINVMHDGSGWTCWTFL